MPIYLYNNICKSFIVIYYISLNYLKSFWIVFLCQSSPPDEEIFPISFYRPGTQTFFYKEVLPSTTVFCVPQVARSL